MHALTLDARTPPTPRANSRHLMPVLARDVGDVDRAHGLRRHKAGARDPQAAHDVAPAVVGRALERARTRSAEHAALCAHRATKRPRTISERALRSTCDSGGPDESCDVQRGHPGRIGRTASACACSRRCQGRSRLRLHTTTMISVCRGWAPNERVDTRSSGLPRWTHTSQPSPSQATSGSSAEDSASRQTQHTSGCEMR